MKINNLDRALAPLPLTEVGIAMRAHARARGDILYAADAGWHAWREGYWQRDLGENAAQNAVDVAIEGLTREALCIAGPGPLNRRDAEHREKLALQIGNVGPARRALAHFAELAGVPAAAMDDNRNLFCVTNGTVTLKPAATLRPSVRDDLNSRRAFVAFDAAATCPQFDEFLEHIQPSRDLRAVLQRWAGQLLLGAASPAAATTFVGDSESGAPTFAHIMRSVLATHAAQVRAADLIAAFTSAGAPSPLLRIRGSRAVFTRISGSDRAISVVRRAPEIMMRQPLRISGTGMRRPDVEFAASFHLTVLVDGRRRTGWPPTFAVIPFDNLRVRAPKICGALIAREGSGILNWMIEGTRTDGTRRRDTAVLDTRVAAANRNQKRV